MKNQKWWILAAMTSCISMIFIDITVLPVALPTIQRLLDMSETGLQWILNAYTLTLAVFVLAGGRLADIFGHRRTFCIGLILFSFASALCGLSTGEKWFIFSRALQGIGGAFLIPSSSAIVMDAFPVNQRGRALGIYVSVGSIFLAIGPFIGGLFSEYFSWRYVFWMNLPIAFTGFVLTMASVPKSRRHPFHFDWKGFATFSLGATLLIIPLMQALYWGWTSIWTIGMLLAGLSLFICLGIVDRKIEDPYIDFSLFRSRPFLGAVIASFALQFLVMVTVFWSVFFQNVVNFTPAETGMINLIANAPIILIAPIGGILNDKYGPRVPMTIGFALLIFSLVWFLQIYDQKNIPLLLTALIPFGCAPPLIFSPSMTTVMTHAASHKRGLASGTLMTVRQIGATLGLAIFGTLYIGLINARLGSALALNPETRPIDASKFSGLLAKAPSAMEIYDKLSYGAQQYVQQKAIMAHLKAFADVNWLAVGSAFIGLVAIRWLVKARPASPDGGMQS